MKHIEQIQPEVAAVELSGLLLADATATAALTRLLHDWTGCDIPQTADTPESEVEELVPLCLSILRRHWTTPLTALGDGTTPMSLADLLRRLIGDRVQGNESMCIPPVHDNIPAAVSALRERKISGVPEAPDGLSLPRLLCDSSIADTITELIDDNIGWTWDMTLTAMPSIKRMTINAAGDKVYGTPLINHSGVEELNVPYLNRVEEGNSSQGSNFFRCPNLRVFRLDRLTFWQGGYIATEMPLLKELNMPNCTSYRQSVTYGGFKAPALEKMVLGKLTFFKMTNNNGESWFASCHNLIHLEIGQGSSASLDMGCWNPTTALADNLSLFLSNFRLYIADRLSDNGSGKTLTLSQEVRDAIHSAGIDTIITNKGWTISPVPTT